MKTWITSDLHFSHQNIIKYCPQYRLKFDSVKDMNEALIDEWNSKINRTDMVYFLGDLAFIRHDEQYRDLLEELNGQMVWIAGNHDHNFHLIDPHRHKVSMYKEVNHGKTKVCMFHYPIESWNKMHHGSVHFHGHSHGSMPPFGRRMDVGWDSFGRILEFSEAVDMAMARPVELSGDHHGA